MPRRSEPVASPSMQLMWNIALLPATMPTQTAQATQITLRI